LLPSHLAALGNDDIEVRDVLSTVARLSGLHLQNNVHAVTDLAKNDVLVVQEGRGDCGNEELRAICIWPGVLERHGQIGWLQVRQDKKRTMTLRARGGRTAMERRPGWSCLRVKFSSSKDLKPQMQVEPEPSPFRKSPPWHMNLGI
jgi:hypothetical protein